MRIASALVLTAVLAAAAPAICLEKWAVSMADPDAREWALGSSCQISYYNICSGWMWCWSGFGDDFKFGVVFENSCSSQLLLDQTTLFICTSAPTYPGSGFTGTIAVHNVDEDNCPVGVPLASQPYLPQALSPNSFQTVSWGSVYVSDKFAIVVTMAEDAGFPNPATFGTDHPAAGPSGPQACGTCYPVSRSTHSFMYGPSLSPICPGSTFNDGICDANLIWQATLADGPFSVEESSWGKIKTLYR